MATGCATASSPATLDPGLTPGWCSSRAHDRENLGFGGRRVQVSRAWSGKTLREHRADRAAVVRAVLAEAGIDAPDTDRLATSVLADDGLPRFTWEEMPASEADYVQVGMGSVLQAQRWRCEYDEATRAAQSRASPDTACGGLWRPVRQPLPRGLPTASQPRSPGLTVQGERSESRSDTKCP